MLILVLDCLSLFKQFHIHMLPCAMHIACMYDPQESKTRVASESQQESTISTMIV